jgi:hypothetical protein
VMPPAKSPMPYSRAASSPRTTTVTPQRIEPLRAFSRHHHWRAG